MLTDSIDVDYDTYLRLVWRVAKIHCDLISDHTDFTNLFIDVLTKHGGHVIRVMEPNQPMYMRLKFNSIGNCMMWALKYM